MTTTGCSTWAAIAGRSSRSWALRRTGAGGQSKRLAGATFYTANKDFLGGHKREQKPIYSAQGHVIYNVSPGTWVAANLSWFAGGRTSIDEVEDDNLQENWRVGAIVAMPLNRRVSLKANASTGVSTRTGNNYDLYGIALQYRWGAGS